MFDDLACSSRYFSRDSAPPGEGGREDDADAQKSRIAGFSTCLFISISDECRPQLVVVFFHNVDVRSVYLGVEPKIG